MSLKMLLEAIPKAMPENVVNVLLQVVHCVMGEFERERKDTECSEEGLKKMVELMGDRMTEALAGERAYVQHEVERVEKAIAALEARVKATVNHGEVMH